MNRATVALFLVAAYLTMATVPTTFLPNSPAKAAEVNANFDFLDKRVDTTQFHLADSTKLLRDSIALLRQNLATARDSIQALRAKQMADSATLAGRIPGTPVAKGVAFFDENGKLSSNSKLTYTGTAITSGGGSGYAALATNGGEGASSDMVFLKSDKTRWVLRADFSTAEVGLNKGSEFNIISRDDQGGYLNVPVMIPRAVTLPLRIGGDFSQSTQFTGGVLVKSIALNSSLTDTTAVGGPWYGLAKVNIPELTPFAGGRGNQIQLAGYFGLRMRSGSTVLDFPQNGAAKLSGSLNVSDSLIANNGSYIGNLAVAGTITSAGTTLNVPDYVFEPDYKLRPLAAVAEFVQTNKHLPDVPSAQDIQTKGLDLVQMNLTLLKKVEELTLHLIEQDRKLSAQAREIEDIKLVRKQTP